MKTSVKKLDGNKAQVKVVIDKEDIDKKIAKQYKDFAQKYNFPGFRKGRAPRPVIDNALGKDAVVATVTDEVVNENLPLAIDKHELFYIGKPQLEEQDAADLLVKEGQDFVFYFNLELQPTIKLNSYEPVKIEVLKKDIDKQEIEEQIQNYANNYADYKAAKAGTKIENGMQVFMDLKAKNDDGKQNESLTNQDYSYIVGSDLLPKEFDENIEGLKVGDKKAFSISKPESSNPYHDVLFEGTKKIDFDAEIKEVRTREDVKVTDKWVKEKMGLESADEFRKRIEDSMKQERSRAITEMKELACLEELEKRCKDEVPQNLAQEKENELLQEFFRNLQQQNMTFDIYLKQRGISPAEFKVGLKEQAENTVKDDMCLDSWAKEKNIKVSDGELEDEFKQADANNYKKLMEDWAKQGRLYIVRAAIKRQKAMKQIVKDAVITEISMEQLKEKNEKKAKEREARIKKLVEEDEKKRKEAGKKSSDTKSKKNTKDEK
ncbi:MAG: trigger factor [Enterococcus sp.]|nr:trigger factor [Enterococcus sp.]